MTNMSAAQLTDLSLATTRRMLASVSVRAREDVSSAYRSGFADAIQKCARRAMELDETCASQVKAFTGLSVVEVNALDAANSPMTFSDYLAHLASMSPLGRRQHAQLVSYFKREAPLSLMPSSFLPSKRKEYMDVRGDLIAEWARQSGTLANQDLFRADVDWHHVIPLIWRGPNAWFNILPLRRSEHIRLHVLLSKQQPFDKML